MAKTFRLSCSPPRRPQNNAITVRANDREFVITNKWDTRKSSRDCYPETPRRGETGSTFQRNRLIFEARGPTLFFVSPGSIGTVEPKKGVNVGESLNN